MVEKDLAVLRTSVNAKLDKLKHYDSHEYDPDCKFCVTNSKNLIESASQTKEELDKDKAAADDLVTQKNELLKILDECKDVESNFEKLGELKSTTTQLTYEINEADSKVLALSSMIESLEKDVVINDKNIKSYYECKDIIEFNKKLQLDVNEIEIKLITINKLADTETEKAFKLYLVKLKLLKKNTKTFWHQLRKQKVTNERNEDTNCILMQLNVMVFHMNLFPKQFQVLKVKLIIFFLRLLILVCNWKWTENTSILRSHMKIVIGHWKCVVEWNDSLAVSQCVLHLLM